MTLLRVGEMVRDDDALMSYFVISDEDQII